MLVDSGGVRKMGPSYIGASLAEKLVRSFSAFGIDHMNNDGRISNNKVLNKSHCILIYSASRIESVYVRIYRDCN